MVKRKKIGAVTLDEDKRNDEGTLSVPHIELQPSISECSESSNTLANCTKNRVHITRTTTKEVTQAESTDSDPNIQAADKTPKVLSGQRISNRIPKRLKKEANVHDTALKKSVVSLKPNAPLRSKTRRPWELWSVEDKNSFFEALCEYGKDFESIQSYIAQRSKKKGIPANMIKNKDQVRHFYYRTWHKISKHLAIGDEVRKQTQEIYGLINYAELRKKIGGCLNEKNRQKLNELVFNGVTTVKYKGKKLRIKTPVCRALKKLNNVSESKEPEVEKLPKDIAVEFRPQSNHAWLHIQNLAQNPRVRTKIPLQRRLKSVIEYLQNKWKPYRLKKKDQILSNITLQDHSHLADDPAPLLHLRPYKDCLIANLTISAMDNASSSDVCLEKYLKVSREQIADKDTAKKKTPRFKLKLQTENEVKNDVPCKLSEGDNPEASTKDGEHVPEDNFNINLLTPPKSVEEMEDLNESVVDQAQRTLSLLSSMTNPVIDNEPSVHEPIEQSETAPEKAEERQVTDSFNCTTIEEIYLNTCQDGEMLTLGQILSRNSGVKASSPELETPVVDNVEVGNEEKSAEDKKDVEDSTPAKSPMLGWNVNNVGLITIGELYLMLGRPNKIILEYEFEFHSIDKTKPVVENKTSDSNNVNVCNQLGDVMRRLMQVASSTFVEFKNKQISTSPTYRNLNSSRSNSSAQSSTKTSSRCTTKNTSVKTTVKSNNKLLKMGSDGLNINGPVEDFANKTDICSTTNSLNTICSAGVPPTDNHVFVMPVAPAPRIVKKPTQESLREEMDKLLPSTRRGCRVRRKPLVVQRPLLPRDGIGTIGGPRPMTLVHLVPSGSQLTAVIPSIDKANVLPSKKVVKILSAGPAIDVRPLHVPLISQPKSIATTHLVVNPVTSQAVDHQGMTTIINQVDKRPVIITSPSGSALPNMPDASSLSSPITVQSLSTPSESISLQDELISSSPPQISIPDTPYSSSSNVISPFITISMTDGVSSKRITEGSESNMLDFSVNSEFAIQSSKSVSVEPLSENLPSSENTPPQSPPNRPFRISSPGPEAQWLNGESSEFSLNTLLNTLESPCKVLSVSSSMNLVNENSNSDPITRLAPVVDSQVRCLLEECSVDFITKFEDLADVINSSNNDSKPS